MTVDLSQRRLVFITGKGGVGKTALTAALARALVARGRRVLTVEMGSGSALARRFGLTEAQYEPREVSPGLHTTRLTPGECLREYGLMKLKFKRFYEVVFENPFVRSLVNMTPGMEELLLLGKLGNVILAMDKRPQKAPYDVILVDAPPTGQGTGLLALPGIILNAVSVGPLARETAFLQALLADPDRTAVCIATTPEELAVDEALEQVGELMQAGLPVQAVLANRVLPRPERAQDGEILDTFLQARRAHKQLDADYALVATAVQLLALRQAQEVQLDRLRKQADIPILEVPLIADLGNEEEEARLQRALGGLLQQEEA